MNRMRRQREEEMRRRHEARGSTFFDYQKKMKIPMKLLNMKNRSNSQCAHQTADARH